MTLERRRSRILQFFSKKLLEDLYAICKNNRISDNNLKVKRIIDVLDTHGVDYNELGPGTNRFAILIDNYVFKIALDQWGIRDNINEFTMSQELQPFVIKTYELNDLMTVSEYVTVISREEFDEKKPQIQKKLAILAETYLLGDVGTISKNFCNWGYRDDGELVILDYAYIYRVKGDELLCTNINHSPVFLNYDENFHKLVCPVCGQIHTFMDIRRKVTLELEKQENDMVLSISDRVTKPIEEIDIKYIDDDEQEYRRPTYEDRVYTIRTEDETMGKNKKKNQDFEYVENNESDFDDVIETMRAIERGDGPKPESRPEIFKDDFIETAEAVITSDGPVDIIEINRETPTEKTQVRIFRQGVEVNEDSPLGEVIKTAEEAANLIVGDVRQQNEADLERAEVNEMYNYIHGAPEGEVVGDDSTIQENIEDGVSAVTTTMQSLADAEEAFAGEEISKPENASGEEAEGYEDQSGEQEQQSDEEDDDEDDEEDEQETRRILLARSEIPLSGGATLETTVAINSTGEIMDGERLALLEELGLNAEDLTFVELTEESAREALFEVTQTDQYDLVRSDGNTMVFADREGSTEYGVTNRPNDDEPVISTYKGLTVFEVVDAATRLAQQHGFDEYGDSPSYESFKNKGGGRQWE